MDGPFIEYYDGETGRPIEVEVLLIQDKIHLYHQDNNELIYSLPLSECHTVSVNERLYVYFNNDGRYLVLEHTHALTERLISGIKALENDWFSKLFKQNLGFLIGLLVVLLAVGYFTFMQVIPVIGLKIISANKEIALGEKLYQSLIQPEKIDTGATNLAQQYADALHLSNQYAIHVTVVRNSEVNAFALPGGFVIINTGILDEMKTYDELAALLGHEVSHVNSRHSLQSIISQLSASLFLSLIVGDITGVSAKIVNNAEKLRSLSYSRKLETESDRKGMELMVANQLHPKGMLNLMKHLQTFSKGSPISFLSTHPLTEERIQYIENFIKQLPKTTFVSHPELEELWRALKDKE